MKLVNNKVVTKVACDAGPGKRISNSHQQLWDCQDITSFLVQKCARCQNKANPIHQHAPTTPCPAFVTVTVKNAIVQVNYPLSLY